MKDPNVCKTLGNISLDGRGIGHAYLNQHAGGDLANVPTWKKLGIDSSFGLWRGLAGPRGMSRAQVAFWDDVLGKAVKTEEWRKDLEQSQVENAYKNSADTGKYWKSQYEEVRGVLMELGLAK